MLKNDLICFFTIKLGYIFLYLFLGFLQLDNLQIQGSGEINYVKDLYPSNLTLIDLTDFKYSINQDICDQKSIGKA